MKISGIVVEYNPLHYGHIYHIQKTREITNCDILIAVMSGNFVQRGEPALIDKWQRTKAALDNGVDIVIELPFIYCNQSAKQFAQAAITLLNIAKVDSIVFGSESNNLDELSKIASMSINVDNLKEVLRSGIGFPKAYGLMAGEYYPNDILAIAYLKALINTSIQPYSIQRTTHYHDTKLDQKIVSAKAIRTAILNDKDIKEYTPMDIDTNDIHYLAQYYPYIRSLLLTLSKDYLKTIFLFNEGIENHLIKQADLTDDFETFINNTVTRRYSRARIQRTLIALLTQITKHEVNQLPALDTLRILGFNQLGQKYLRSLKDNEIKIATRFNQIPKPYRKIEYKTTLVYNMFNNYNKDKIKKEISSLIIKK